MRIGYALATAAMALSAAASVPALATRYLMRTGVGRPDYVFCSNENERCYFIGRTVTIRYGLNGSWVYGVFTDDVYCHNSVFGDPYHGYLKGCWIKTV